MGSSQGTSSSLSLGYGSAVGGGSSFLRNKKKKKKKFDYNNGKCLHGIEAVVLKSGTDWNPGRLFRRCPLWESAEHRCEYFVWVDKIENKLRNVGTKDKSEGSPLKQSYPKIIEFMEGVTKVEDVLKLQRTVNQISEEIKCIKKMVMGIYFGLGFCALLMCMIYAQK